MWLLAPIGLGVVVKVIYDSISEDEKTARKRWKKKRKQAEKSIKEHRKNIKKHIKQAKKSYDFHFLADLHYSSMKVANSAYQLLDDVRISLYGMNKMLKISKEQKSKLQDELENLKKNRDKKALYETIEQLKMVNELRKNIFEDRDKIYLQKESFLLEVKRLNNQTRELKELIRDRCGNKGREWYNRRQKIH